MLLALRDKICAGWACLTVHPSYVQIGLALLAMHRLISSSVILALDGGEDGLEAFRAILSEIFGVLRREGFLIFETGHRQAQAVRDMMVEALRGAGRLEARILVDLSGRERAVAGQRQSVESDADPKKKIGNPALSG